MVVLALVTVMVVLVLVTVVAVLIPVVGMRALVPVASAPIGTVAGGYDGQCRHDAQRGGGAPSSFQIECRFHYGPQGLKLSIVVLNGRT